jgi:hypothetical protein
MNQVNQRQFFTMEANISVNSVLMSQQCYIFFNGVWKMNRMIFQPESGAGFVCVRATTCKPPAPPPPPLQPLFTVQSFYIFIEPDWLFCQPEIGIMTTETIHNVHTLYVYVHTVITIHFQYR